MSADCAAKPHDWGRPAMPANRAKPAKKAALWILLAVALVFQSALRRGMDEAALVETPETIYVSSADWLRGLSLGYAGLLADIYWTRAIQYFGAARLSGQSHFGLLGPLLQITTALDPHLIVAYSFGAIFLAGKPPGGAGRPREAMQLLRRGMVANPGYWRFWEDLGFIEYWDLRNYTAAARDFKAGSQQPGAPIWMKTLAASVAAKGGELRTSQILWTQVYRTAVNDTVRQSALNHLAALKAVEEIQALDALLTSYRDRERRSARSFRDLISAGFLPGTPRDPSNAPYVVDAGGKTALGPASKIDLRLAQ